MKTIVLGGLWLLSTMAMAEVEINSCVTETSSEQATASIIEAIYEDLTIDCEADVAATHGDHIEGFLSSLDRFHDLEVEDYLDLVSGLEASEAHYDLLRAWSLFDTLPISRVRFHDGNTQLIPAMNFDESLWLLVDATATPQANIETVGQQLLNPDLADRFDIKTAVAVFNIGSNDPVSLEAIPTDGEITIKSYEAALVSQALALDASEFNQVYSAVEELRQLLQSLPELGAIQHWPSINRINYLWSASLPLIGISADRSGSAVAVNVNLHKVWQRGGVDFSSVGGSDFPVDQLPSVVLRVFMTQDRYNSDFSSKYKRDPHVFADRECNRAARRHALPGTYQAFLGTTSKHAFEHLGDSRNGMFFATIDGDNNLYSNHYRFEDLLHLDGPDAFKVIGVATNPASIQVWNGPFQSSHKGRPANEVSCNNYRTRQAKAIVGRGSDFFKGNSYDYCAYKRRFLCIQSP